MNNQPPIPSNINVQELLKKGEEIYQQELRSILEPTDNGKYVALEVESKRHFIGNTKDEAVAEAKKVFPNRVFVVRRIGEVEKIASYSPSLYPLHYDWLL